MIPLRIPLLALFVTELWAKQEHSSDALTTQTTVSQRHLRGLWPSRKVVEVLLSREESYEFVSEHELSDPESPFTVEHIRKLQCSCGGLGGSGLGFVMDMHVCGSCYSDFPFSPIDPDSFATVEDFDLTPPEDSYLSPLPAQNNFSPTPSPSQKRRNLAAEHSNHIAIHDAESRGFHIVPKEGELFRQYLTGDI